MAIIFFLFFMYIQPYNSNKTVFSNWPFEDLKHYLIRNIDCPLFFQVPGLSQTFSIPLKYSPDMSEE